MFRRSHCKKASVNIPKRKWKTSRPIPKDWDNSVTDLSVHKASEEEVQRRKLIHKSKNASAARRALGERAKRIFMDPASPSQVEMEMKKLAILKEVLYDHDDLNEVLKRVDNTMLSVKTMFHGAPFRTAGNANVTLAPGIKTSANGPVSAREEPTTQLSLLSDSIMDKHALNEESSDSEIEEDDEKFESKIDYERFLNILKDSINRTVAPSQTGPAGDANTTPINSAKQDLHKNQALNRTEEVERTKARVQSSTEEDSKKQKKKIDDTISNLVSKNPRDPKSVSFSDGPSLPPPRANISAANMTYENLQDAMETVSNNLSELENRRGNEGLCQSISASLKSDGLAGFTATLIDAVTRLTIYVNEAEGKLMVVESKMAELRDQNDHQRALLDALTAELMSTQEQNAKSKAAFEQMQKSHDDFKKSVESDVENLKQVIRELQDDKFEKKKDVTSNLTTGLGDVELIATEQTKSAIDKEKEEREEALKADMLSLLGALKSQKPANEATKVQSSGNVISMTNNTTRDAAQTVASVESQLRHLQLQHVEAQNRLQEFTLVASELARRSVASRSPTNASESTTTPRASPAPPSIVSGPLTPYPGQGFQEMIPLRHDDDDSISTMTITSSLLPNIDTSRPSMQSNEEPKIDASVIPNTRRSEDLCSLKSSDRVYLSEDSFHELEPYKIPTLLLRQTNINKASPHSEDDNLSLLEKSINQALSALPSFKPLQLESQRSVEKTENLTTSIKETQSFTKHQPQNKRACFIQRTISSVRNRGITPHKFNLEDRIADLNRQHAEAQARLQNLLRKRASGLSPLTTSSESSGTSFSKVIQVTLPTDDMLKTPKLQQPAQPFRPMPFDGLET